jgi:hypothetical protein
MSQQDGTNGSTAKNVQAAQPWAFGNLPWAFCS